MLYSTVVLAATAFSGLVSAANYSTSGPLSIDATQIPQNTRLAWCQGQINSCTSICGGRASPNTCDSTNLSYQCTCTDGSSPNISDYTQTMPFFVCEQWIANCVDNHPNDLNGITGCRSVVCGSKNASAAGSSQASGSATGSSGAAATSGGSAASGSVTTTTVSSTTTAQAASTTTSTSTKTGAAVATMIAKEYGHAVLAVGALAAFGLAL